MGSTTMMGSSERDGRDERDEHTTDRPIDDALDDALDDGRRSRLGVRTAGAERRILDLADQPTDRLFFYHGLYT